MTLGCTQSRRAVAKKRTAPGRGWAEDKGTRGATVLVVDDDAGLLGVVRAMLEMGGYSVLAADCGEDALDVAAHHEGAIDLLLTDVLMPGIQGPELAEQLTTARPELRVLFMSGASTLPDGGLVKPFSVGTLLRTLQMTLEGGHDA